jgi:NAD(P)-dependent dehydrogenase (short-subunit alcohol dehydrogenase family)
MSKPVVLITGALTGIGRATAVAFAREGARLIVSGRHEAEGQALAKDLRSLGAEAEFVTADVRNEEDVRNLVDRTVARFGHLDVAVNNAGTEGRTGPLTEQTEDTYRTTFDTNVLGVILSLKHELRVMYLQRHGSIINISSVAGRIGFAGASIYVASKHAVEGLTKSAALEAAPAGVRVNAVAPGPIETPMLNRFVGSEENKKHLLQHVPIQRAGEAGEVAETVLFLASEKASYVTGQSYAVDGGRLAA